MAAKDVGEASKVVALAAKDVGEASKEASKAAKDVGEAAKEASKAFAATVGPPLVDKRPLAKAVADVGKWPAVILGCFGVCIAFIIKA